MFSIRQAALGAVFFALLVGCGAAAPVPSDTTARIQSRVVSLERAGVAVRGERLLQRLAVARFYKARQSMPAWDQREAEQIVGAIRGVTSGKVKFDGTNFGGGIVEYDLEGKLHFDEDDDGGAQDD